MFLNAAVLLLSYRDPANREIITQLSKLMRHSADLQRGGALRLLQSRRSSVIPMLLRRVAGIALMDGTSARDARVTLIGV